MRGLAGKLSKRSADPRSHSHLVLAYMHRDGAAVTRPQWPQKKGVEFFLNIDMGRSRVFGKYVTLS